MLYVSFYKNRDISTADIRYDKFSTEITIMTDYDSKPGDD